MRSAGICLRRSFASSAAKNASRASCFISSLIEAAASWLIALRSSSERSEGSVGILVGTRGFLAKLASYVGPGAGSYSARRQENGPSCRSVHCDVISRQYLQCPAIGDEQGAGLRPRPRPNRMQIVDVI